MLSAIHEQTALAGLVAIAVHGLTLLGDPWLNPGPAGIAVPFTIAYRPLWVGLGIVAGYLAALLGLSFYVRRRIGPRLWRRPTGRRSSSTPSASPTHSARERSSSPWLFWPLVASIPVVAGLFLLAWSGDPQGPRERPVRGRPPRTAGRAETAAGRRDPAAASPARDRGAAVA